MKLGIQSLQFRRANKSGRKTMRMVWDIVSRDDSAKRLLIETWGGKPDGYIKCFATDLLLGNYLSGRIAKSTKDAKSDEIEFDLVGDKEHDVEGSATLLSKAIAATNHENAKLRAKIVGSKVDWDEGACLSNTLYDLTTFDDVELTVDKLTQAMASRVKLTFKRAGSYKEHLSSIHEFMNVADDLSDVLDPTELAAKSWPLMDRERIAEVIQSADGMRNMMIGNAAVVSNPDPVIHTPEPAVIRGESWGGWA